MPRDASHSHPQLDSSTTRRSPTRRADRSHSYNRYLAIAARAVRRSLKDDKRIAAERRGEMELRFAKWSVCHDPGSQPLSPRSTPANCTSRQNGKQGEVKDLGAANTAGMAESASS